MLFMLTYNRFVILNVSNKSLEMGSVLICKTVNTEKYNSHKQKTLGGFQLCLRVERGLRLIFF